MTIYSGIASMADVLGIEAESKNTCLPRSTYEMIRQGESLNPEAPALSFFLEAHDLRQPLTWSYRKLVQKIHQTANLLDSLGSTKSSVIAYLLPNLPETHCVIWGGQATGIVCAINPLLEPAAIAELLQASGARILVTLAPFPNTDLWLKVCEALQDLSDLRHLILVSLADQAPELNRDAARQLQKQEEYRLHGSAGVYGAVPNGVEVHDFNRSLNTQPSDCLRSERLIQPDDISSYFCTGGTTGTPKLAMRSHRNEVANAWSTAQLLGNVVAPGKNIFCGLPLFHVNAVLVTGLLAFSKGAHVILGTPQGYRGEGVIKRFWEIVEEYRINFFSGVPTIYAALLQIPVGDYDIGSLEYGLCGAAPMPVEVFRNFQDRTGLRILEGYGLTEGTCVSSANPPLGERRLGSIGLRIPGQNMKAVLLDDQGHYLRDCGPGEVGVLVISGPNVFAGYTMSEQNRYIWLDTGDHQQWLNTGDLGQQDEDGYFWLTGRKKELIIRGGHNIDPATIEEPLHRHPAVQLAAAVGRPDVHAGELPVVYVQLQPGAKTTEAELQDYARATISERAAQPKAVHIVDELPLTGVGKIFKPALRHREIRNALLSVLQEADFGVSELRIIEDPTRGTIIQLVLADSGQSIIANKVLGHFALTIELVSA